MTNRMPPVDLDLAAREYLATPEAQHGDEEMARMDAGLWFGIFSRVLAGELWVDDSGDGE